MNNEKNGNVSIGMVRRPKSKARAVTMDLFGAMQKNEVELQAVLSVLGEAVTAFLMPLGRHFGFDKGGIVKVFGDGLITAELNY